MTAPDPSMLEDLRNIVELAEPAPDLGDARRRAEQLAGIEGRIEARSGRRRWALAAAAVVLAASAAATVDWRRSMRTQASDASGGHQAPAFGGAKPSVGRSTAPELPATRVLVEAPLLAPEPGQDSGRDPGRDPVVDLVVPERPTTRGARRLVEAPLSARRADPEPAPEPARHAQAEPGPDALLRRANAARGIRDVDAARSALLELRERFPDAAAAEEAMFLLGRVEHDLAGDREAATRWFARYVDAYPDGRYAASARGRVLEAHADRGDGDAARRAARDVVDHDPDGPYAKTARRVLDVASDEDSGS